MKKASIIFLFSLPIINISLYSQSITFTKQLPKTDEVCESQTIIKMNLELNIIQNDEIINTLIQSNNRIEKKIEIVLESEIDNIKKIRIDYLKSEETEEQNNEKKETIYPVSEKSYIIDYNNLKKKILYLNGEIPSEEEIKYIEDNYDDINSHFVTKELDDKTLKQGERVPYLESELLEEFGEMAEKYKSNIETNIYYKKNEIYNNIDCAVFDVKIIIAAPLAENIEMKFDIAGEVFIDINTTWGILIKLNGPITTEGFYTESGEKFEMKGKGYFEIELSNNFSRYKK